MTKKKKPIKSPIRYFGGKQIHVKKILQFFTEHHTYVEVFGGGASVLLAKNPSPVEVYNDIDGNVVNFFRVLRDKEKFEEFKRLVELTPYSREEHEEARRTLHEETNDIERAKKFFISARMSFSGVINNGFGYVIRASHRNMASTCAGYISAIERLPEVSERLRMVQIENDDFRKIIPRYDTEETLFYCDPPYVHSTRRSGRYKHEMSDDDHKDLVALLLNLKGKVILSGYENDIYKTLEENGFKRYDYSVVCDAVIRSRNSVYYGTNKISEIQKRKESLWMNYEVTNINAENQDTKSE